MFKNLFWKTMQVMYLWIYVCISVCLSMGMCLCVCLLVQLSCHIILTCSLKNLIFELQLSPVNHKICGLSWNFVAMTMWGISTNSTNNSHFVGKVCRDIWNKEIKSNQFAWRYEVCPLNNFLCTQLNHHR